MADFSSSGWGAGATVTVYARDAFGNATGAAVTSGTASAAGTVTFSGLADSGKYVATDGSRTVKFGTPPASSGSSGAFVKAVVEHGSDAAVARPTGFTSVEWIGTVQPDNATADDTWVNPSDSTTADLVAHNAATTSVHGLSDTTRIKAVVNHGSTAGTARPAGFASVEWIGTVSPSNALSGDTWINPNETAAAQGSAGGDLAGSTYPNPVLADGVVTLRKMAALARPLGQFLPTGAKAQTLGGRLGTSATGAIATGQAQVAPIVLTAGVPITSLSFVAGSTALAGGSNQWFFLLDAATRAILATTVDDGATAWAANTAKTLLLATAIGGGTPGGSYTPANAIEALIGVNVVATTMPTLQGNTLSAGAMVTLAPAMAGRTGSGLTNPASLPNPAAAIAFNAFAPFAYAS